MYTFIIFLIYCIVPGARSAMDDFSFKSEIRGIEDKIRFGMPVSNAISRLESSSSTGNLMADITRQRDIDDLKQKQRFAEMDQPLLFSRTHSSSSSDDRTSGTPKDKKYGTAEDIKNPRECVQTGPSSFTCRKEKYGMAEDVKNPGECAQTGPRSFTCRR